MSHPLASPIRALAAAAMLAWAGGALAQTDTAALGPGYSAADAPLGSPAEIQIDLKGRIAPRCELVSPPLPMNRLALTRAGESQAAFALDCNAPFLLRVRSGEGGFASTEPMPGIETLLPYELSVSVGADTGRRDLGWCPAAALSGAGDAACAFSHGWSSGEDAAIGQTGVLRLRWAQAPTEAPLFGAYRDTIVIELEVRS